MTDRKKRGVAFWATVGLVALPLALLASGSSVVIAEEGKRPEIPPLTRRVLAWLPEDTESIVAGQAFTMPARLSRGEPRDVTPEDEPFAEAVASSALGVLSELDAKYRQSLAGMKIALALRGNRNFYAGTATLPTHQSENCSVIIFEKNLGETEKPLIIFLRAGAAETRKIAGRDAFAFPASRDMQKEIGLPQRREWLGIHVVVLDSKTLLCATSDRYLGELLKRIDTKPVRTAIPDNLNVWKQIDPQATAWMVWHPKAMIEKYGGEALIDGMTWTVTQDELRVNYLSAEQESERFERIARKTWNNEQLDMPLTIERMKDGEIVVSASTKSLSPLARFWLTFCLYHLEDANCGSDDK